MNRRVGSARAQRGFALLALLAVIVMVFAYVITSRLNAASAFVASDREFNSTVLARAKRALIGYMAQQASLAGENNPGRLPCPEAVNAIGVASAEGIAAPLVSPSTPSCATLGRLPWRTIGLEKLVDASSEPLWYAVSPGWSLANSTSLLTINPDSVGTMRINPDSNGAMQTNGVLNPAVIAVIIAPGPPMNVQASPGCSARQQARGVPGPAIDPADYVECFNAATPLFSTRGPASSFNDQVITVTTADLMLALEAAIQERMQREIAPAVRSTAFELDTNSPRRWVATAILSSSPPPIYPYPVAFTVPTTSLSNYRGALGTSQGLLPFAPAAGFVSYQAVPANVIKTTANGKIANLVCGWESATGYGCTGDYEEQDPSLPIAVQMNATFTNVAMGLRARNTAALIAEARDDVTGAVWSTSNVSTSKILEMNDGSVSGKPRGSVTATLSVTLPNHQAMGWGKWAEFHLRLDRGVIADHPLLSNTGRGLRFSGGFAAINNGNTITGASSGASGAVQVVVTSGSWSGGNASGFLFFTNVSGSFQSGESLRVSGATRATSAGTDFDIGWFARNEWYRNVYYAVADQNIPDTLPSVTGCDSTNCLRFNDDTVRNTRVLLVIAGRKLDTQTRPSSNFADYIEYQNADSGTYYEQHRMRAGKVVSGNSPWNDRLVIVDWISPGPTFPLAYLP
jgi:type II secretory pathway pseudopilin PulG